MLPVDYCHTLKQVLYKLFFVRYEIKQRKATQLYENEGHHIVAATPPGVAGWPILLKWVQRLWDKICYKWCVTTPAVCEHDYPTQFHLLGLALILQSDSYLHVRAAATIFDCALVNLFSVCLSFPPSLALNNVFPKHSLKILKPNLIAMGHPPNLFPIVVLLWLWWLIIRKLDCHQLLTF